MSADQLYKEASQLTPPELEQFVSKIISLRAQRSAPSLSGLEAELLKRINQGLPIALEKRFAELVKIREAGTLTTQEHEEIKGLSLEIERREADRIENLSKLADLRGTTLPALMENLGLVSAGYA